ncbi:MAG: ATP-binding protein [Hamadaea sp.]|nr:ATP-binding protein [Hamadaea sp.]NUT22722.1 ATP-binding protein [Hamadaea sp.]
MDPVERAALAALSFDPAPTPDDVWRPSAYDVPELHERVVDEILSGVGRARRNENTTPMTVAMQGRAGAGKTHLLGAVRERIQRNDGFFFLVNLINGQTFWESTALCVVEGLDRDAIGWGSQLKTFHRRLTPMLGLPPDVRDAVAGDLPLTRERLDAYLRALRDHDPEVGRQCQDTARALVLHGSQDYDHQDVGYSFLQSEPVEPAARTAWGFSTSVRTPQLIVRDISRLIALTLCPTVIAVDQVDTLFAQANASFLHREGHDEQSASVVAPVADGLLNLRDSTRRTLIVISCLPDTWELLRAYAPKPVMDRIQLAILPDRIPTADIGRALVAKRFATPYADEGFTPPHETWPIAAEAFGDAVNYSPRDLLKLAFGHVQTCLTGNDIRQLHRFDGLTYEGSDLTSKTVDTPALDQRFAELVAAADVSSVLDPQTVDEHMPALIAAGLAAWIDEQAPTGTTYKHDPLPGAKPPLHGRLVEVLDEATENEAHWGFRVVSQSHAVAVINRVKAACTKIGLDIRMPQRRLVLLRNTPWPTGPRTSEILEAFRAAGGVEHGFSEDDLRTLYALRRMREEGHSGFTEWLVQRRPAGSITFFRDVLPRSVAAPTGRAAQEADGDVDPARQAFDDDRPDVAGAVPLGQTTSDGQPFAVDLESLRRHCVIFAGSGSGKTVLIRRLVEECALQGVSSIVLDPNNDLARLGDAWPSRPDGWGPADPERAQAYLADTEVVVWTPRVMGGRPLAFQPLPDFASIRESPDELDQAIRSAVEALAPRAGVTAATRAARHGKAVLTEALQAYARGSRVGLRGFVDFLAELPDGVSTMAKADKLSEEAAETLKAAMVTDPLFGGDGTAADPGALLTPSPGKRARISVISFVGLPSEEERQSFVNQLQMALFAWVKRNPAGDRPLGGLFVMDEAQTLAPSAGSTPCTASTIALASQARKYGLGLVFATQAPKGLHNQISGNATTQFFGLLNSPAQIDAAKELAAVKSGRVPDIGILKSGQFYAAGEGFSFIRVDTPMCLSHHPRSPLTEEEVIQRAR